jgi:hypothetical protein
MANLPYEYLTAMLGALEESVIENYQQRPVIDCLRVVAPRQSAAKKTGGFQVWIPKRFRWSTH